MFTNEIHNEIHQLDTPVETQDGLTVSAVNVRHVVSSHGIPETHVNALPSHENLYRVPGLISPSFAVSEWMNGGSPLADLFKETYA